VHDGKNHALRTNEGSANRNTITLFGPYWPPVRKNSEKDWPCDAPQERAYPTNKNPCRIKALIEINISMLDLDALVIRTEMSQPDSDRNKTMV
jgi:hypothetical protein